ncbi:hypothetical protein BCR32DRAFT_286772 [Anaeromyces robustus]|uniref:Protein-tyrosine-phosphatase n=1 Tax=Anaeromyces robustus TaxID=1754192 RepID=A0A1Y1VUF4_9FUNG|nr:hypothetical protein BCR32DRAFT_286772 [Anaeromyces robustus]|eukprot:ORX64930.1 hypothetical protein BCR32DRAFT_286772 [Anaeromyces robustus]
MSHSLEGFYNITEFNSPVEIHTVRQKEFLSYSGKYDEIDPSLYPNGNQLLSDSLPVNISWDYKVPKEKIISNFNVTYGQKPDLSDGYSIVTTNKFASLINSYLGINYFRITTNFTDGSKDQSNIHTFKVDETCPRNLTIEGLTNCRDLGGRILEDGGKIKQGLIYRTSGNFYDYHTTYTQAGKIEMLEHLKFKTEINVSDGLNFNLNLPGTIVKNFNMDYGGNASHHFSRNSESLKNFFNILADSKNYPIFFHCRIGTDRSGLCAIILYGLLGVPLNEIYQDYLFSNFGNIQDKRYIGIKAGHDNIKSYINAINQLEGKTFKNKLYNALLSIGLSSSTLDTIINLLTEGPLAKNNNTGQIVATAEKLRSYNVQIIKDTSKRNHPNYYYTLDHPSKSVSYSFISSKIYKGQVVAYLGNMEHSRSKKIGDAINCKLDSKSFRIKDQTYAEAGMGNCNGRMNYNPVILGEINISPGKHTIMITGTNNPMNIGSICIFEIEESSNSKNDLSSSSSLSSNSNHLPIPKKKIKINNNTHTHCYQAQGPILNKYGKTVITYLCDCSAKYITIDFLNDHSYLNGSINDGIINGKLANGTIIKYDIPAKADTSIKLQFAVKISDINYKTEKMDLSKYTIKINNSLQPLLIPNNTTYEDNGINSSNSFSYITFCKFDINNDRNIEIELNYHNDHDNDNDNDINYLIFGEQIEKIEEIEEIEKIEEIEEIKEII